MAKQIFNFRVPDFIGWQNTLDSEKCFGWFEHWAGTITSLVLVFSPGLQTDCSQRENCEYQSSSTFLPFQLLEDHELIWIKVCLMILAYKTFTF